MAGSGFQLDSNQLTPGLYRVVLTMTNTTYYPTNSNSSSGSVNPYDWTSSNWTNATSMTATQALYLAQGNLRWQAILDALDGVSDCRLLDITSAQTLGPTTASTDATIQPVQVAFTVQFDRDGFVLGEWNNYLKSQGQASSGTYTNADGVVYTAYTGFGGTAVTTTALAIQDIVTWGIMAARSRAWRVYSPSLAGDTFTKVTIASPYATASTLFGTVGVTQISGTTLAGSPL